MEESRGEWKNLELLLLRATEKERKREKVESVSASVICTVSKNPQLQLHPQNRLAISPSRFVSPATNKQRNEHGPISHQQRLVLEAL